ASNGDGTLRIARPRCCRLTQPDPAEAATPRRISTNNGTPTGGALFLTGFVLVNSRAIAKCGPRASPIVLYDAEAHSSVDKRRLTPHNRRRSGVPVGVTGQKGIRCDCRVWQSSPELPPQLSAASPASKCHCASATRCGKAKKGQDPRARRPA